MEEKKTENSFLVIVYICECLLYLLAQNVDNIDNM